MRHVSIGVLLAYVGQEQRGWTAPLLIDIHMYVYIYVYVLYGYAYVYVYIGIGVLTWGTGRTAG